MPKLASYVSCVLVISRVILSRINGLITLNSLKVYVFDPSQNLAVSQYMT